jgi:hypothetical protein
MGDDMMQDQGGMGMIGSAGGGMDDKDKMDLVAEIEKARNVHG